MKLYSEICPVCGKKSEDDLDECQNCGALKTEYIENLNIAKSISNDLSNKINIITDSELYVRILFNFILLVLSSFLIPEFIKNSSLFLFIIIFYTVIQIIKNLETKFPNIKFVRIIFKYVGFAYIGAGFGCIIANSGLNNFSTFSQYFSYKTLIREIELGNKSMLIIGASTSIMFLFISSKLYSQIISKN